jgi:predicted dehydrogenase
MPERQHGFALIGAGLFGEQHARGYQRHRAVRFEAVCDRDAARAEAIATRYGARRWTADLDSILRDPAIDAVSIATPDHAHRDVALACLAARKHVLIEKPLATSLAEAREIAAAARTSGVKVVIDFHNRLNPPMVAARDARASGELGTPAYVYARLSNRLDVPETMLRWSAQSSALWFLGSHMIDIVCWILGELPTRVFALKRQTILAAKGIAAPDFHVAVLEFPSGVVANFEHAWFLPRTQLAIKDLKLEILGSEGAVYIDGSHNRALEIYGAAKGRFQDVLVPAYGPRMTGFVLDAIAAFVDTVVDDAPPLATLEDGLANVRIVEKIIESAAAGGQPLTIDWHAPAA